MTAASAGRADDRDTGFEPDRVVVRDRRRLDPQTGEVKAPAPGTGGSMPSGSGGGWAGPAGADLPAPGSSGSGDRGDPGAGGLSGDDVAAEQDRLAAELTADLQRVTAEYANYRKRVERDRAAVVELATAGLLTELLPLLDDVERARQHGDLTGAFAAVGERLESVVAKAGLERFGVAGEPFDPSVHEALMQAEPDPTASVATCAQVLQTGYRLRSGRVLRPARVAVAEPAGEPGPAAAKTSGAPSSDRAASGAAGGTATGGPDAGASAEPAADR